MEESYRRLALAIIQQAIRDGDEDFFYSEWFCDLMDLLGYSSGGARELALQKIREWKERRGRVGNGG